MSYFLSPGYILPRESRGQYRSPLTAVFACLFMKGSFELHAVVESSLKARLQLRYVDEILSDFLCFPPLFQHLSTRCWSSNLLTWSEFEERRGVLVIPTAAPSFHFFFLFSSLVTTLWIFLGLSLQNCKQSFPWAICNDIDPTVSS